MGLNRRRFLTATTALTASSLLSNGMFADERQSRRKFTMALACGPLGVRADLQQSIDWASRYGFEAVEPKLAEIQRMPAAQRKELMQQLAEKNLVWGSTGVPADIRAASESEFAGQLKQLPAAAEALQSVGVTRLRTYLRSHHAELTYLQNFKQHADRIRRIGKIIGDYGLRFGLEYVGTRQLLNASRYPFLHTLAETRELIAEVGLNNIGIVPDSWHWYVAEETRADLLQLTNADVVGCDLNDAPTGIAVVDQIDNRRELPAATGVIDVGTFLDALVEIGFDGPIRCEPFNQKLREMDNEPAVETTAAAMKRAFGKISS